jgi:p21-activated kinase 1
MPVLPINADKELGLHGHDEFAESADQKGSSQLGPPPLSPKPVRPPTAVNAPPKPGDTTSMVQARPQKSKVDSGDDIVDRLRAICNPSDPTKLYRNLVKIGQG